MIVDNKRFLSTREGRDLFYRAKKLIEGTEWYDLVFPVPMSDLEREFEKDAQEIEDHFNHPVVVRQIEDFFNDVYPHVDFSKGE